MTAQIIDGKVLAARVREDLAPRVDALLASGRPPQLGVLRVGDDPASRVYINQKRKACQKLGLAFTETTLPATASRADALGAVHKLCDDRAIDGVLVQLPLPDHLDPDEILEAVDPTKDVDGFHPLNMGRLTLGYPSVIACTPLAIMRLIESTGVHPVGHRAVVIGRSNIVGKPTALLLVNAGATVTLCHRSTVDLAGEVGRAHIVVAAAGSPGLVKGSWIKPGAVVIDVGVNRVGTHLVGDVEFAEALEQASFITPVPGGVGPMTVAMLLHNLVELAARRRRH